MFKVTGHDKKSVGWWFSHKLDIDFEPPYQRQGHLWNTDYKANLIDSIINEFDIPKIYLADFTIFNSPLNKKNKSYAIIDGRQRFEANFGFYNNEFALNNDFIYYNEPNLKLGGLTYADLLNTYPEIADKFKEFNLDVMSVITDEEAKINDLFVRLNTSKPLTGAEIRNAMSGKVPLLIRSLVKHKFFKECVKFSKLRGGDKNAAAKILLLEFRGKLVDTKRFHLDEFVREGVKSENADVVGAADRVDKTLMRMCSIFGKKDVLLASEGDIPLYYWIVKTIGPKSDLREFLVTFERDRARNRALAGTDPISADQELLKYDLLRRSINDQGSYIQRYEILIKLYKIFTKTSNKV